MSFSRGGSRVPRFGFSAKRVNLIQQRIFYTGMLRLSKDPSETSWRTPCRPPFQKPVKTEQGPT
jgi:hypothetical protein